MPFIAAEIETQNLRSAQMDWDKNTQNFIAESFYSNCLAYDIIPTTQYSSHETASAASD